MVDPNNPYTQMQKGFYNKAKADQMVSVDHRYHDGNADYWSILLGPVKDNREYYRGKKALDFGCGTGRNVNNLLSIGEWNRVDGVDISPENIEHAKRKIGALMQEKFFKLYVNNGVDLSGLPDDEYDFVMSTIVFQHIAVHEIRFNLLKEIYRTMKSCGIISIQMGYGEGHGKAEYEKDDYDAKGTNSKHDVIVRDPDQIKKDLDTIGFIDFEYVIRPAFQDGHPNWIFFKAKKP